MKLASSYRPLLAAISAICALTTPTAPSVARQASTPRSATTQASRTQKRWLFVWADLTNPAEVDKIIARFPAAQSSGYNGVAFSHNVAPERAAAFRDAAKKHGLDLIVIVMGGGKDRNYVEGPLVKDALFVAGGGKATHVPDNPTRLQNGGFDTSTNNRMTGWPMQDDVGVTTFADTAVKHGGASSLRMENIAKNEHQLCRLAQPLQLQPHRQYLVSVWIKTENLRPAIPEIKVLTDTPQGSVSWQTFHVDATQDWKQHHIVFNSMDETAGRIYLGFWGGKDGKIWWDDMEVREIALTNVLRRPGCPVTVRGESGTSYEEGRDYQRIFDPEFHPYIAYRGSEPSIKLTPATRVKEGERLRVSYYHPLIIYEDRLTYCVTEPRVFEDWREEVFQAEKTFHPRAFLMSHDEMRVMNLCALCRSQNKTPGELLAANVKKAAQIIRDVRPDAEIWVWNDMFDPMHNAVDRFYAVSGTLKGSWKGLDKDVGIVNWHGGLEGKNCRFFADLGLKQILSGYYDGDEDGSAIRKWFDSTQSVPGIVGAMYTTWEGKYGAMTAWAQKAWGPAK
jgi:hypothetical protein